jgi:hypothetical protein
LTQKPREAQRIPASLLRFTLVMREISQIGSSRTLDVHLAAIMQRFDGYAANVSVHA